jgi:hypothetical protein
MPLELQIYTKEALLVKLEYIRGDDKAESEDYQVARSIKMNELKKVTFEEKVPFERISNFMVSKDGTTERKDLQLKLKKVTPDGKDPTLAKGEFNLANYMSGNWIEDTIKLDSKKEFKTVSSVTIRFKVQITLEEEED